MDMPRYRCKVIAEMEDYDWGFAGYTTTIIHVVVDARDIEEARKKAVKEALKDTLPGEINNIEEVVCRVMT